jgi:hypothetical protein
MKSNVRLFLLLIFSPLILLGQSEVKESDALKMITDTWTTFHVHQNVMFSGVKTECQDKTSLSLKVVNSNNAVCELRVGFLNGSVRLAQQIFLIQPYQEIVISCSNNSGTPPIFLTDGDVVRIETQVIKRN